MSITFFAPEAGDDFRMNLANRNAADLLEWLGYDRSVARDCEKLPARDLAARCRRRLWNEARNHDAALPETVERGAQGATMIDCGREAGYMRLRTEQLLELAAQAGDGFVSLS